jgi:putative SOS response-associated peptidase YedK
MVLKPNHYLLQYTYNWIIDCMCGRFSNTAKPEWYKREFKVGKLNPAIFNPRYNIAPSQMINVIREEESDRAVSALKWGLVPSWAKDAEIGNRMINARAETITEKPSFREAFKKRRCIITCFRLLRMAEERRRRKTTLLFLS